MLNICDNVLALVSGAPFKAQAPKHAALGQHRLKSSCVGTALNVGCSITVAIMSCHQDKTSCMQLSMRLCKQ
eukprot:154011-Pelagomonas_calceolata.AAC.4